MTKLWMIHHGRCQLLLSLHHASSSGIEDDGRASFCSACTAFTNLCLAHSMAMGSGCSHNADNFTWLENIHCDCVLHSNGANFESNGFAESRWKLGTTQFLLQTHNAMRCDWRKKQMKHFCHTCDNSACLSAGQLHCNQSGKCDSVF